eukprot:CAMPEP_0198133854 /NCGR_PEP_ID=MMETSP1442-20131203/59782_1 /TAXON_ID= /ORGANISM="Craspedostauros australis, Strain CCMP3328" /LENGTH=403 /DNA_ID=CAMNT_0043794989 /DNA_START=27 /DNA_END=1238 /DNA_ORIENTATION=-
MSPVIADRGIVCVDEFDKMGENDRVAIHEAMEQQTVTIAKAGMHASLNARCSVLAAANPVFGQYDKNKRMQENIGLPDSLLSRFDLLFIVLDLVDPETDRMIANHVIRSHQYRPGRGDDKNDSDDDMDDSDDEFEDGAQRNQSIWQKSRLAGDGSHRSSTAHDTLQHDFLRKYLRFAKRLEPELSEEATEFIANEYAEMRCRQDERTLPVTARTLETVIRLATAHAKLRLSHIVAEEATEFIANEYAEMRCRQDERTLPVTARTLETVIRLATAHAKLRLSHIVEPTPDCEIAMEILSFALYNANQSPLPQREKPSAEVSDDGEPSDAEAEESAPKRRKVASNSATDAELIARISQELDDNDGQMELSELCSDIQDRDQIEQIVERMEQDDKVMVSEGTVMKI